MTTNAKWVALLGLLALSALFIFTGDGDSHAAALLSDGIDTVICSGEDLLNPVIELFATSETRHKLCQRPHQSKPRRRGFLFPGFSTAESMYHPMWQLDSTFSIKRVAELPLAPALYVFGDSLSDSGNNNFLQTLSKANYTPYGIDFPSGVTGRFTNGKTYVDFLAESLGLPYAPPYLGLSASDKIKMIKTGVNYASGTAGILPESGKAGGDNLSLEKQIQYFQDTVENDLIRIFTPFKLLRYLSKSIFAISIGSNDYLNNYLQPAYYNSSQIYTPEQFADLLVLEIRRGLKKLYFLGARKFLVYNIGRIGCVPGVVNSVEPKLTTPCAEDVNSLAALYNSKLFKMINKLERILFGSTFVRGDAYFADPDSIYNGTLITEKPCCGVGADGLCLPDQPPCPDRSSYRFYDDFHSTEDAYRLIAEDCFSGYQSCTPLNVQQLAQK